ncbi:hypothetical protein C0991_009346 [Blastosporella zonata]|nr:hypothetical protein C0991_009346 [Blastosporella zonata]
METIAQISSREVLDVLEPTLGAFIPLLEANRAKIQGISRKTFKYGPTERHQVCSCNLLTTRSYPDINGDNQLDVYYPDTPSATGKTQILVWSYGGGFVTGDRQMPPPADLAYACVGSFFAHRGFIVIIPDYRLAPATIFPGAAEDVRDAILWAIKNQEHLTTPTTPSPNTAAIFLMGHSAGAIHVISALTIPETPESSVLLPSIAGVILHAGVYDYKGFDPNHSWYNIATQYYGGVEGLKSKAPLGLLQSASDATVAALPRVLLVLGELEPEWISKSSDRFGKAIEAYTGKKPTSQVAKGHNHVSANLALATGEGEEWAEEVITWIRA